jgi:hypothetical protein
MGHLAIVMRASGARKTMRTPLPHRNARTAAFEIRLRAAASFPEKLPQLVGK